MNKYRDIKTDILRHSLLYTAITLALSSSVIAHAETISQNTQLPDNYTYTSETDNFVINNNASVSGSHTLLTVPEVSLNSGNLTLDSNSTINGDVSMISSSTASLNLTDSHINTTTGTAITAAGQNTLGSGFVQVNLTDSSVTSAGLLFSLTNASLTAVNSEMSGTGLSLDSDAAMTLSEGSHLEIGAGGISVINSSFTANDSILDVNCPENNCTSAVYLNNIELGSAPALTLNNSQLNVTGDNSDGIYAKGQQDTYGMYSPLSVNINKSSITTNGMNSNAIVAEGDNVNVNISDSTINANGGNSSALVINPGVRDTYAITSSTLTATGSALQINGKSATLDLADHTTLTGLSGTAIAVSDKGSTQSGKVSLAASNNSTINGDVVLNSTNASADFSLSLKDASVLTGAVDSTNYSGTSSLDIDDNSRWDMTASSSLTSLTSSGTLVFANGNANLTLAENGSATFETGSKLVVDAASLSATPLINHGTVSLAGEVQIDNTTGIFSPANIISDRQLQHVTLIDADNAIQGDFDKISLTADMPDYLTFSGGVSASDDTLYTVGTGLSWNADAASATGDFTLDAMSSFTVTGNLTDRQESANGWDGKTLTKKGAGTLVLSGDNTFSGGMNIEDGKLIAANVNALGSGDIDNSGWLLFDANSAFDLSQNITTHSDATLQIAQGSTLHTNELNLEAGSTLDVYVDTSKPVITAQQANLDGTLNISGVTGDITSTSVTLIDAEDPINGDFENLTIAGMTPDDVDFLTINGRVNPDDNTRYDMTLGLNWYADNYNSLNAADGTFTLSNPDESFTLGVALTDVAPNAQSGWDGQSLTKEGEGELILTEQNTYSGATHVNAGTLWLTEDGAIGATGSQQRVDIAQGATLGGTGTINGNVISSGNIAVSEDNETGGTLTINGNYTGNNGTLTINSQLGDDASPTDKLVIAGDTAGNTTLYVNNVGGLGAPTQQGIEVVDVGGASNGTFTQGNQVQTGLYEYRLYEDGGDWYLRSQTEDSGGDTQYRADIGAYMGNQWMVRNLQMQSLFDRQGSQLKSADGSMWARFKAGTAQSQAVDGNISIDNDYSQFQLGSDLAAWHDDKQSLVIGAMGSYIKATTDSTGNRGADGSQFSASGNVDGYNVGLYATWFADAASHNGFYLDSWYQYGFYNNTVDNGDVGSTDYDSTANAVSLEAGYRYDIPFASGNILSVTPQSQVVWQRYDADSVTDNNGTRIDGQTGTSWTSRLGVRVDGKLRKDDGVIQPFAEVNWLHTNDNPAVSFDGADVQQDLPADRAELKMGIQANIQTQWSISAQATGQTGSNDYRDLNGSIMLRYHW